MKKFSAMPSGFAYKAAAMMVAGMLHSTAGATQLPVTNMAEKSSTEAVEETAESEEITDKRHPDYVRCRTESIIGSLARKRKICLTNRQWTEARKSGNRMAHEMVNTIQSMSGGSSLSSGK